MKVENKEYFKIVGEIFMIIMYNILRQNILAEIVFLEAFSMIENVSSELKKYFEGKPLISSLLGLDMILLYGAVALMILNSLVSLGGLISGLLFYIFLFSILLCLANTNFSALMIGLGAYSAYKFIDLIITIFKYRILSWGTLYAVLIYGFFAYMAYKKSLAKG